MLRGGKNRHGWGMVKKRGPARAWRTNTPPFFVADHPKQRVLQWRVGLTLGGGGHKGGGGGYHRHMDRASWRAGCPGDAHTTSRAGPRCADQEPGAPASGRFSHSDGHFACRRLHRSCGSGGCQPPALLLATLMQDPAQYFKAQVQGFAHHVPTECWPAIIFKAIIPTLDHCLHVGGGGGGLHCTMAALKLQQSQM